MSNEFCPFLRLVAASGDIKTLQIGGLYWSLTLFCARFIVLDETWFSLHHKSFLLIFHLKLEDQNGS